MSGELDARRGRPANAATEGRVALSKRPRLSGTRHGCESAYRYFSFGCSSRAWSAYLIVTLPAEHARPEQLNGWARLEWHIKNRLHWVRDMTLREDEQRATTGNGPAAFAVLHNTAIGYHRSTNEPNIARAIRRAARRTSDLIRAVTSTGTTTQ